MSDIIVQLHVCKLGCSVLISHSFTIITVAVLCIDMKQVTPQALSDFHIVEVVHLYHVNKIKIN